MMYKRLFKRVDVALIDALDIIQWMSGSYDFAPEGKAYKGWMKVQGKIKKIKKLQELLDETFKEK